MSKDPFAPLLLQDSNEESKFHLKEFVYKYSIYWKWFVLALALSLVSGFIYLKVHAPIFSIHSSILIKDQQKGIGQEDDMMKQMNIFSSNKVVDNEIQVLASYTLMKEVVDTLKLNVTYYLQGLFRKVELYNRSPLKLELISTTSETYKKPLKIAILNGESATVNGQKIFFNKETNTPYGIIKLSKTGKSPEMKSIIVNIASPKNVAEDLSSAIRIEPSSKMSTVLVMTIENTIPEKGEDILNQLINAYNAAGLADKNLSASNTLLFINERLKLISGELGTAEKQVEDYKSKEGITDISAASQIFLQNVQTNDTQLNTVKLQQSVLNDIEKHVTSSNNDQGSIPQTLMGLDDPTLLSLIGQLSQLELQRQATVKVVKPGNPIVQGIDEQIATLKHNIYDNIETLKRSLDVTRQQLEKTSNNMTGMIKTVPVKERKLVDITRQQTIKDDLYTFLLKNREQTELSFASTVSDTRTVDRAISSDEPVKPKKGIVL
ncbi:GNVR domain-containing protein, partial [uncultured Mucilaginibacter sp.]|uniref:GumC family protein n=1 Tax=uncultured Mucilaginibacter sp. TaxID=797541 RepID=UPI0025CD5C83